MLQPAFNLVNKGFSLLTRHGWLFSRRRRDRDTATGSHV